jgi:hypothetical protein
MSFNFDSVRYVLDLFMYRLQPQYNKHQLIVNITEYMNDVLDKLGIHFSSFHLPPDYPQRFIISIESLVSYLDESVLLIQHGLEDNISSGKLSAVDYSELYTSFSNLTTVLHWLEKELGSTNWNCTCILCKVKECK